MHCETPPPLNARVSLLVVLANLSRQCLLVGCGSNYVQEARLRENRFIAGEKRFRLYLVRPPSRNRVGLVRLRALVGLTPTGPRPEGPQLGTFSESPPRTCCKSAVGWGCGKSPIGLLRVENGRCRLLKITGKVAPRAAKSPLLALRLASQQQCSRLHLEYMALARVDSVGPAIAQEQQLQEMQQDPKGATELGRQPRAVSKCAPQAGRVGA